VLAAARASLTPLGRDQGIFQYVAWAIGQGAVDYRDTRDVNGPLTPWVHLVFLALGGADEHRFRVLDLVVTSATFAIAGACLPGLWAKKPPSVLERAAWALAGCVVLDAQYLLYGFWDLAQRESFFDWFLLPSVGLQLVAQAARRDPRARSRAAWLFAGAGALSVTPWFGKPTYLLFTSAQVVAIALDRRQTLPRPRALSAFAVGAALGATLQLAFLALHGDPLAYFRIQAVDVPAMYRFIWPRSIADLLSLARVADPAVAGLVGAAVLVVLVLLGEMPVRVLPVALLPLCAVGNVIAQRKGFPYHLHPLTAGVALQELAFASWITERSRVASRRKALRRLLPLATAATLSFAVASALQRSPHVRADFLVWRWEAAEREGPAYLDHFAGPDFFPYELRQTASYLREHTTPADRVQTYGMDPYVLFLARRLSATPYIYAYDLNADAALAGGSAGRPTPAETAVITSIQAAHEADLRARIEASPPAAFVFFDDAPTLSRSDAWSDFAEHCPPEAEWVRARYRETARFGHDRVWLRLDRVPPPSSQDSSPAPAN
jgi:hypothetical protein